MPGYTVVQIADVPDSAEAVGMPPELFEIRFMRQMLGLENFFLTFERFRGGCHGRPHRTPCKRRCTCSSRAVLRASSATT